MRRVSAAFVAAMVTALVAATVVDARRPATTGEKGAIAGADARCMRVYISTADRHYASTEYDGRTYGKDVRCTKIANNGIEIYRRSARGRWRDLGGMSDCPPRIRGVPAGVYRDLTRMFCR